METFVQFKKADAELHLVFGEVYAPDVPDSQGDFMTADEIRKMAHKFLSRGEVFKVDRDHDLNVTGAMVVESFIAREGDPDFIPGSWVVGVHIPDDDLWEDVKKGEINGFSMYGGGARETKILEIELPSDTIEGATVETDGHVHRFFVKFDDEGNFLGGQTDEVNGHSHHIRKGASTEETEGHRHRYSFLEALTNGQD